MSTAVVTSALVGVFAGTCWWLVGSKVKVYKQAVELKKNGISAPIGTVSNCITWITCGFRNDDDSPHRSNSCTHYACRLAFAAADNSGVHKFLTVDKLKISEQLYNKYVGGVFTGIPVTHLCDDFRVFQLSEFVENYTQYSSVWAFLQTERLLLSFMTLFAILPFIFFATLWGGATDAGIFLGVWVVSGIISYMAAVYIRSALKSPSGTFVRDVAAVRHRVVVMVPAQAIGAKKRTVESVPLVSSQQTHEVAPVNCTEEQPLKSAKS